MSTIILGKRIKSFSKNIKLKALHNSTIVELQVSPLSLFTKILPKTDVAVFGDYDIFIFYSTVFKQNKNRYKVKSIRKLFCQIIHCQDILKENQIKNEDIQVSAMFTSRPTCRFSVENSKQSKRNKLFWKIQVLGEIKVTLTLNKTNESKENSHDEKRENTLTENDSNKLLEKNTSDYEVIKEKNVLENVNMKNNIYKKTIEVPIIVGEGSTQILVIKEITISPPNPPIWRIKDIDKQVIIYDKTIISNKVIVDGCVIKTINYETIDYTHDDTINGRIYCAESKILFSGVVDIISDSGKKINEEDTCEVVEAYVEGENNEWGDSINTKFGEIAYQKILERMVVKINVKITRNEHMDIVEC
ncbi:DUF3794 domain-containing protein [Clostridium sp. ZS2-4]|uniref:DUF3794 domain-containing protein n=1 Tax=Clostridium sp. ZS2-4 TaxID=2987703 RepID=UPI00227D66FA|nr:DUF3794 domain-containing protein [Clostridium sp. ZS2-4]MCY6355621.1 DUF3794 domain-containing protein [Clostridium sp. ZS2-4]